MAVRAVKDKLKTSKSLPQVLSSCTLCNLVLGTEIGTRYRYIDDTPLVPLTEAGKANGTNAASSASGAKTRSRPNNEFVLYSYGEPVAMSADGNASYFGTDILGSVRSVTDKYGSVKADYSYDAFGSPYLGNLENDIGFGYTGKAYDNSTGLYDYGFRDYSPVSARFTTIDPIRDGSNWFSYVVNDPVNYIDPNGLFYYNENGQQSITTVKKTNVVILRNHDGIGNEFDSTMLIYKNDGFETKLVYVDSVGANCKQEYYDNGKGSTTPDGTYYLTNKGTNFTPLYNQPDGTTNSTSFKNVLSLRTDDQNLTQEQRQMINIGDRLFHADEWYNADSNTTKPYNSTKTPGGAGCIISHTQTKHDTMMDILMEGVQNPETITVSIRSMNNVANPQSNIVFNNITINSSGNTYIGFNGFSGGCSK